MCKKVVKAAMAAAMGVVAMAAAPMAQAAVSEKGFFEADSDGKWLVRLRGIGVIPDEDSSFDVPGLSASVGDAYVPELDITYFFTPNVALELILATAPHDVDARGALNADLGEVWLLPPTLTAQYHITELGRFKPYVGAGINYTFFYNVDDGVAQNIEYEDSFGFALQAGLDYEVAEGVYLNADVKKLFLSTDVTVTGPNTRGEVDIDPWIIGVGVGYRF